MAQGGLGSLMMQTHIYENGVRKMAERVGVLRMQPSGRWAVCRPGQEPIEITSGEPFRVEVDGAQGTAIDPNGVSEPPQRWRRILLSRRLPASRWSARCSWRARIARRPQANSSSAIPRSNMVTCLRSSRAMPGRKSESCSRLSIDAGDAHELSGRVATGLPCL